MKKINLLFLLPVLFFINSCSQDSVTGIDENNQVKSSANRLAGSSESSLAIVEGDLVCGGSSGTGVILDPSQQLITSYNVSFWDGSDSGNCLDNGRTCIDLSHFVGANLPRPVGRELSPNLPSNKLYYGSSRESDFDSYVISGQAIATYTIGETNNDGTVFGGNPYISDENTNKVLQAFKDKVIALQSQGYKIRAYHVKTDALLCIPPYKFVRLKIKYSL